MIRQLGRFVAFVVAAGGLIVASAAPVAAQLVRVARITVVTNPSATTGSNIDVAGGLPFTRVKRYTVSISPMVGIPAGVDTVEVRTGVLMSTSDTSTEILVLHADAATLGSGAFVGPFVGTGSYVRIVRGADGLGPIEVSINAYVEVGPASIGSERSVEFQSRGEGVDEVDPGAVPSGPHRLGGGLCGAEVLR